MYGKPKNVELDIVKIPLSSDLYTTFSNSGGFPQ